MARFFQSAVKNTIIFSTALFSAFTFAQGKLAIVIDDIGYHPKEDAEILIKKELKDSSAFTAFKRWLIWDNGIYSELEKYIPEN